MRKFLVLIIVLAFAGVQTPAVIAQEEATPTASPPPMSMFYNQILTSQACAWPVELAVDALNIGFPDKNSAYFIMPYYLSSGQSLVLKGSYPIARFSSLVTYYRNLTAGAGRGLELLGWIPDYALAPDAGSVNPAVDPNASTDPASRRWTVRLTGTASASGTPTVSTPVAGQNVLPAMPTEIQNAVGIVILRIYVPQDSSDPTGGVGLPSMSLEDASGASRPLTPCTAADRETWKAYIIPLATQIIQEAPQLPLPPGPDVPPQWVQITFPGLGTNPDNRYLAAPIAWKPGRIVVLRGQAPTFPNTQAGDPQSVSADLRYWTYCTGSNLIPLVTASCASDFEIPIAADGTYTIVVSQPADRPANATADSGVTWLQGGDPTQADLLYLRHLLPSKEYFSHSVWAVPEGVIGAAADVMGPYYPQITYCDTATFASGGADACFAQSEATPNAATPAG